MCFSFFLSFFSFLFFFFLFLFLGGVELPLTPTLLFQTSFEKEFIIGQGKVNFENLYLKSLGKIGVFFPQQKHSTILSFYTLAKNADTCLIFFIIDNDFDIIFSRVALLADIVFNGAFIVF